MNNIANFVDNKLTSYERTRPNLILENGYLVRTAKILSNYIIISYLLNFPLFSHKFICVSVFSELLKLQLNKNYKNKFLKKIKTQVFKIILKN